MKLNRPAVNATGDGKFRLDQLCSALDTLVAMRWQFNDALRISPDLPGILIGRLRRVDSELDVTIDTLKTFIREHGLSL